MTFLGLGANLPSDAFGPPRETLEAALTEIARAGVEVRRRSSWYRSRPVPPSDQPWFVNAVVEIDCPHEPAALMTLLHSVEERLGRTRSVANAARVVDLDLIDYDGRISATDDWPVLPHPRAAERAFVLVPLLEIAPDWRHPVTGKSGADLLAGLPNDQEVRRIDEEEVP